MSNTSPQIGYAIKQAQSLLHLRMEEALQPLELSVSHYSCLFRLRLEPGISAAALARRVFMTRQSMNVLLQQLIDRDLVARPPVAESGRALPAELTPAGNRVLDAAGVAVDAVEHRMLSGLTPAESAALGSGLAACIDALAD